MKIQEAQRGTTVRYQSSSAGIGRPARYSTVRIENMHVNYIGRSVHVRGTFIVGDGYTNAGAETKTTRCFELDTEVEVVPEISEPPANIYIFDTTTGAVYAGPMNEAEAVETLNEVDGRRYEARTMD